MMKGGKDKMFDTILAIKLDRISRNVYDMYVINKMLSDNQLHLICIFENFDTTNTNGRIVQRIITSVSLNEIERTSEGTKIGMDEKDKTLEKNRMQNFMIFLEDYFPLQI